MNSVNDPQEGNGSFKRTTAGQVGGLGPKANTFFYSIAGKDTTTLEWNGWFLLDNYSNAGENVSVYAQANSRGKGPTWGACIECCDMGELGATQLGAEITMNMAGPDKNANRMGLDVTINDARLWRGKGKQIGPVEATVGVRVNADGQFSWRDCFQGWGFRRAGLHLRSLFDKAVGLMFEGRMETIIDAQGAYYSSLAKISSNSGAFVALPVGPQIGYLRIIIDGSEFALPIHSVRK